MLYSRIQKTDIFRTKFTANLKHIIKNDNCKTRHYKSWHYKTKYKTKNCPPPPPKKILKAEGTGL